MNTVNPAKAAANPPSPDSSPPRTWLDIIDNALRDSYVRRDALIALAMVLATIVLSAWLLAGTPTWLTLTGSVAAGTGVGLATRRKSRRRSPRPQQRLRPELSEGGA